MSQRSISHRDLAMFCRSALNTCGLGKAGKAELPTFVVGAVNCPPSNAQGLLYFLQRILITSSFEHGLYSEGKKVF